MHRYGTYLEETLRKDGIELSEVADAICNNTEIEDGMYAGPKKKTLRFKAKSGKNVTLRHGGGLTVMNLNSTKSNQPQYSNDSEKTAWGFVWGAVLAVLFLGSCE